MHTNRNTLHRRGRTGRRILAIAMMIGSVGVAACEGDPVDPHGHEEEVDGFALYAGGLQIYQYRHPLDGDSPDVLHLGAGATYQVTIQWLDEEGHPTDVEEDLEVRVTVDDAGVATWTDTGDASGTLAAASVASVMETVLTVELMHGDHADFSVEVPVRVEP